MAPQHPNMPSRRRRLSIVQGASTSYFARFQPNDDDLDFEEICQKSESGSSRGVVINHPAVSNTQVVFDDVSNQRP